MTKKKITQIAVSQEDRSLAQDLLEQYQQIASDLYASKDRQQAEAALATINALPESAQIALVKELAKQTHVEAADVLVAIHELGSLKNVRKEARRSLMRLENVKIYPKWEPPAEQLAIMHVTSSTNPPRFWKGIVTDSLDIGEVQLLLCWQQGDDYKEIRVLGFLLEFGYDGVRDFFTTLESKRSFENMLGRMQANMSDVTIKNCSLAQGRRLLLKALAINKQRGTAPHKDYRFHLSLINQLVLEAPNLGSEEDDITEVQDPLEMDALNTVIGFITLGVDGEYSKTYEMLSKESVLHEGLSKKEWIARRERWAKDANPRDLEPSIIFERVEPDSPLLLPSALSASLSASRKEIEVGWSIEMNEIAKDYLLPEVPEATTIYAETGRRWFWAVYTLIREDNEWRIHDMVDKGRSAQNLSIEELEQQVAYFDKKMQDFIAENITEDPDQVSEEKALEYFRHTNTYTMQATYYNDILIKKLPFERSYYKYAVARMATFSQFERALVYLIELTQRFPEERAENLRRIAALRQQLNEKYIDEENEAYEQRNNELIVEALFESLTLENSFEAHISLAEVFLDDEEHLDKAKEHLLQAKELATEPDDINHIEVHLGKIALQQKQFEQALNHYQYLIKHLPKDAIGWSGSAEAYEGLGNIVEAEANYKHAIELEPEDIINYWKIGKLYLQNAQHSKGIKILKDGLKINPNSAQLNIYLAAIHMEIGDLHEAEKYLQKAEQLDPENEIVQTFRQMIAESKAAQPRAATGRLGKALQQKKMKR